MTKPVKTWLNVVTVSVVAHSFIRQCLRFSFNVNYSAFLDTSITRLRMNIHTRWISRSGLLDDQTTCMTSVQCSYLKSRESFPAGGRWMIYPRMKLQMSPSPGADLLPVIINFAITTRQMRGAGGGIDQHTLSLHTSASSRTTRSI